MVVTSSFIYLFIKLRPFFRKCIKLQVEWSLSVHQDLSLRDNENSLVGFIRGETNLRFQLKLGNIFVASVFLTKQASL